MVRIMWKDGTPIPPALATARPIQVIYQGEHSHPDGLWHEFEILE